MGFQCIQSPYESDIMLASLMHNYPKIWGCMTEDSDLFAYGCKRVIKYFNPHNMKEFKMLYAKHNAFSVFDTSLYENNIDTSSTVFFTSTKSTFIPLMLSLNLKTNQVSVEHTHPPTEYFFGSQKGRYVNLIKKQWIQ